MSKLVATIIISIALTGCGGAQTPDVQPLIAENRRPEGRDLPPDPEHESIPEGFDTTLGDDHIEPMEAGSCIARDGTPRTTDECPSWSGIAVSEARAARDTMYRSRYRELRRTYEADRRVWSAHRELYEAQVAADREEIANLQPTWWERHDGTILTAVGVVVGAAITVAIAFAVNEATD